MSLIAYLIFEKASFILQSLISLQPIFLRFGHFEYNTADD